jgi:hypothetical protein
MNTSYDDRNGFKVFLVWLPLGFLLFSRWIVPHTGNAEFFLACAGWPNLVAVVDIARELKVDGGGHGWKRAFVFIVFMVFLILILAWDLTQILPTKPLVVIIVLLLLSGVIFVLLSVFCLQAFGHRSPSIIVWQMWGGFLFLIGLTSLAILYVGNIIDDWAYAKVGGIVDLWHVWAHLIGLPLIYLLTDYCQKRFSMIENNMEDIKKYHKYSFYDCIMFFVGGSFAVAGLYAIHPGHLGSEALRFEDVAAAAILVLWNIAYVHLYSSSDELVSALKWLVDHFKLSFTQNGDLVDSTGPVDAPPKIINVLKRLMQKD